MASDPATVRRSTHRAPDDAARRLDLLVMPAAPAGAGRFEETPDDETPDDETPHDLRGAPSRRSVLADAVVPQALRGARWSVGASAVLALLVLVGVAGVAAAVRTVQASPGIPVPVRSDAAGTAPTPAPSATEAGQVPAPVSGASAAAAPAAGAPPGSLPTGSLPTGSLVVVHVVGAVAAPGLVTMPAGARVGDALAAAGGAGTDADLARVNLARLLVDGEQVVVPRPGEEVAAAPAAPAGAAAPATAGATGAAAGGGGATATGPLDLNTATLEQLDALPGIGPVLAQRVLDFRTEHGSFTAVDELREVSGIGEAVMADLAPLVRV